MLIEFSVENYRAFSDKQTLSLVASAAVERLSPDQVVKTGFTAVPLVLREACLFGANGSGKSSLVEAIAFMSQFVRNSFRRESLSGIERRPFAFSSKWRDLPSEFEVIFIHNKTLYQYGFSLNSERVLEEWLFARPQETGRQRQIFSRSFDLEKNDYEWYISPSYVKGERDSWKSQTRRDALFLSTAVQLNAESLRDAYDWISRYLRCVPDLETRVLKYTETRFSEEEWRERVIRFLAEVDLTISDISVSESRMLERDDLPDVVRNHIAKSNPEAVDYTVEFLRPDDLGRLVPIPIEEESAGTRSLFALAGPILDVLDNGYTVFIDELNSGLHPLAFHKLIALFCDPEVNRRNAQLLFTSHDTSLLDSNSLSRDQIWMVEKGRGLAARLIPLSDFKPRHDASGYQKRYLQGRFGGIPRIVG